MNSILIQIFDAKVLHAINPRVYIYQYITVLVGFFKKCFKTYKCMKKLIIFKWREGDRLK